MKIRSSFVSNSSSSSFLVVLSKEDFTNLLSSYDEFEKSVLSNFVTNKRFGSTDIVVYSVINVQGECYGMPEDLDDEQRENAFEVLSKFKGSIRTLPEDKKIVHSENF
jgi:hypothetical protein